MTRSEAYANGWHGGRRYAEEDFQTWGSCQTGWGEAFRDAARVTMSEESRAWNLGAARGYRDTVARIESGELTWQMFDQPPLGR